VGEARQLLIDYHAARARGHLERMHDLHEALDAANAWTTEHRIEATLSRLDLPADRS
jgi:ATPase subunit of ABC transporter with duplicated ATPase domains